MKTRLFRRKQRGQLITQLMSRDGQRCAICAGKLDRRLSLPDPNTVTLDHRVPRALGGSDRPENLRLAHARCNMERGDAYDPEWDELA